MSLYAKQLRIIDPNLISGSSDTLRAAVGGSWTQVSSSERGLEYELIDKSNLFSDAVHLSPTIDGVVAPATSDDPGYLPDGAPVNVTEATADAITGDSMAQLSYNNPYIAYVLKPDFNRDIVGDVSYTSKNVQPIIRYPIRIFGSNDLIDNDEHWKTLMAGGQYKDNEYAGIFTDAEYADHWFDYSVPYETLELRKLNLENFTSFQNIDIGYRYNHYYKNYENYISTLNSERLIPNGYILQSVSSIDDKYRLSDSTVSLDKFSYSYCNPDILNFVNRQEYWSANEYTALLKSPVDYDNLLKSKPLEFSYMQESSLLKEYYNTLERTNLNNNVEFNVDEKLTNIIFDHEALKGDFLDLLNNKNALPMYASIKLPPAGGGAISDAIQQYEATTKFLVSLKEIFVDKTSDLLTPDVTFAVQEKQDAKRGSETNTFYDINVNIVDMGEMLFYMRENYLNKSDNFYCIGDMQSYSKLAVYDTEGFYRHVNTLSMTNALASYLDHVDDDQYLEQIKSPYFETIRKSKSTETMAYRIEKIGGAPTGEGQTQEVLQNFYCMNVQDIHRAEVLDTQIKYGQEYTYNIYAYVLVSGYRYQAGDLRVTKMLDDLSVKNTDLPPGTPDVNLPDLFCLEFYDPFTGERKDKLLDSSDYLTQTNTGLVRSLSARALENQFATDAQVASANYKYLADMNITIQPSVKLIEIPIATKTVRVLDHPPNMATSIPFPVKDTSQKIGFDVEYRTFEKLPYPATLTEEEDNNRNDYLVSNSFVETTELEYESVAKARFLEIYRIEEKPVTFKQFDGNRKHYFDLVNDKGMASVAYDILESGAPIPPVTDSDMIVLQDLVTSSDKIFYDVLETNKKYYYTMRFLNERGEPGHFSPIYEIELINDGGYIYPVTNVVDLQNIESRDIINTSINFKKLLNLAPNIQQLLFDDSAVDYSMPAFSQAEKIKVGVMQDPIWNKTFKIRLTSKKTGKKIDLNITYKLSR